eukprot:tig00000498_g1644.t1
MFASTAFPAAARQSALVTEWRGVSVRNPSSCQPLRARVAARRTFKAPGAVPQFFCEAPAEQATAERANGYVPQPAIRYDSRCPEESAIPPEELPHDEFHVPHLEDFIEDLQWRPSPLDGEFNCRLSELGAPQFSFTGQFITEDTMVNYDIVERPNRTRDQRKMLRAGPRKNICYDPATVKAAIVTCGGLCPGLNVVVRELVMCLWRNYGVRDIYGIASGYRGFYDPETPFIKLDPEVVATIHEQGGTFLGSSRGGFDGEKICKALEEHGINHVYIVGGDGTHRGANAIYEETRKRGMHVSVVGVPKTIDNDVAFIDKSFGFDTAVAEATKAIESAFVESRCYPNGIGVVKLMGRSSGFIAMHAAMASRVVDVCLIPEVPFALEGAKGLLRYLEAVVAEKGQAVIVVAEGAGQDLIPETGEKDKSGNKKLANIGAFLVDQIKAHFDKRGKETNIKYIDPTYMIRSVPANAADSLYCTILAQNAVHGAFAGLTGFTCGRVNNKHVYLPMSAITHKTAHVNPDSRMWYRLMFSTMQPEFSTHIPVEEQDPKDDI